MQRMRATADGFVGLINRLRKALTAAELWELCRKCNWEFLLAAIKDFLCAIIMVRPIADQDVPKRLQEQVRRARKFATDRGYPATGYLWWLFQPRLWIHQNVPLFSKCVQALAFMSGWELKNDAPTGMWLVYLIPIWFQESAGKTVEEQMSWMAEMRKSAGLPDHYFSGFGSGALLALLLAAYKAVTGKEPIPRGKTVRTDTLLLFSDGLRFNLRFNPEGLGGDCWDWSRNANSRVGCFLLGVEGVEKAESLDARPSAPIGS